jgi:biopolymer transport protein TolR
MGVSVDAGGGRGKGMNFDLNLVPFIDLLSVCITFLLATAVWTQIMSLQVDQAISQNPPIDQPPPDVPPTPPLTIHIKADGVWAGRSLEWCADVTKYPAGCDYAKVEDAYDWDKLRTDLETDRTTYPEETQVVIVTDDGIEYQHMIAALDMTRELGYDKTLLGGGPAETSALPLPTPH